MRVAFVSMETAHHRDVPAFQRTRRTARLLAAAGHDVTVLCAQWWGGEHVPVFEHEGVEYRRVTRDLAPRAFAARLPLALRRANPDVVHAVNTPPSHVVAAKTAARVLRVPVAVDWYTDHPGDAAKGYRRAVKRADAIVAPSRTVKTSIREYGASDDLVRVVPGSIDFDLVRETAPDDRFDLVYSRHLDEHANVETFLLALAELRTREWRAAVVGDGPAREEAEQTARDLRIDDRVTFTGDLPASERVAIFRGAHVFAQTASVEPFARELLLGLACGCLGVVEYQAGSAAHELVEGRERGRLVTSPQELADEIVAAGGVEQWTVDESYADYDHEEILDRYLELYEELIESYGLF